MTVQGWGTFAQEQATGSQTAALTIAHGQLILNRLRLAVPATVARATVTLGDQSIAASLTQSAGVARLEFAAPVTVTAGQTLMISLAW